MRLIRFSIWRLLATAPVLLGVLTVTFFLVRILPGDPVSTMLGPSSTEEDRIKLTKSLGLDESIVFQFLRFLKNILSGNFGSSIQTGRRVSEEALQVLPATLELIILSLSVALVVGISLGFVSAIRHKKSSDNFIRIISLLGNSIPEFWLGLILILIFYSKLDLLPAPSGRIGTGINLESLTGMEFIDAILSFNLTAISSTFAHLILPISTIVIVISAPIIRSVRASALEVMASDAFVAAQAHGLKSRDLFSKYLLRQTLSSLPTLTAIIFGYMMGSIVLVEKVFAWQGFGSWALRGLSLRDYPVIQFTVIIVSFFYVLAFFLADLLHSILDPRIEI